MARQLQIPSLLGIWLQLAVERIPFLDVRVSSPEGLYLSRRIRTPTVCPLYMLREGLGRVVIHYIVKIACVEKGRRGAAGESAIGVQLSEK